MLFKSYILKKIEVKVMVIVESVFDENLTKEVNKQQLTSKWWLILIFELLFGGLGVIYLIENIKSMAILFLLLLFYMCLLY